MISMEEKTWVSRQKREGNRMKNGSENRLGVTLVTAKKQHRCWRAHACTGVHLRVYVRGRLRVCVRVYASGGVTQLLCFYLVI